MKKIEFGSKEHLQKLREMEKSLTRPKPAQDALNVITKLVGDPQVIKLVSHPDFEAVFAWITENELKNCSDEMFWEDAADTQTLLYILENRSIFALEGKIVYQMYHDDYSTWIDGKWVEEES